MLTDLVQIKRLGGKKEAENKRFSTYLLRYHRRDRRLLQVAEEVESQIDCTSCANCCREGEAGISNRDIEKLAKFIGVSREEFRQHYTMRASDNELILKRTDEEGCVFLKDNRCSVYEARPKACKLYPHLADGDGSVASRMFYVKDRVPWCPIVFNWFEAVKREVEYPPRKGKR